jgi:hypothetical protein
MGSCELVCELKFFAFSGLVRVIVVTSVWCWSVCVRVYCVGLWLYVYVCVACPLVCLSLLRGCCVDHLALLSPHEHDSHLSAHSLTSLFLLCLLAVQLLSSTTTSVSKKVAGTTKHEDKPNPSTSNVRQRTANPLAQGPQPIQPSTISTRRNPPT